MSVTGVAGGCLEKAQEVLEQIKKEVVSSADILDVEKMGPLKIPGGLEQGYRTFRTRFLSYLRYDILSEREREAINVAAEKLLKVGTMSLQESSMLAQARFGRSECVSVSITAASRLLPFNPIVISLTAARDGWELEQHTAPEHNLVLLGLDHQKFMTIFKSLMKVTKLFDGLKKMGGVILDVFLGVACPIAEYQQKAKRLLEYNKAFGTDMVFAERSYSMRTKEAFDRGHKEAEEVHKLAVSLLGSLPWGKEISARLSFLKVKVEGEILKPMTGHLQAIFSHVVWKSKFDEKSMQWQIWSKGGATVIQPIAEDLRKLKLHVEANQIKNSDQHAIILRDLSASRNVEFLGEICRFYPKHVGTLILDYAGTRVGEGV